MLKPGRLCLLAAVLLAAPAAAQGEPALFSVWSDARGGAVLEPILVRGRDSLRAPELDDGFGAEYYRPGAAYAVSVAGVRVGTARVVRSELEGCMHYAAGVALELTAPLPLDWAGLAMSPELGARGRRWMRGATLEEAERLTAMARRLFYVGITRARHRLTLSGCAVRRQRGELLVRQPSRFLQEIPPDLLEQRSAGERSSLSREDSAKMKEDFFSRMREMLANP